MNAKDAFNLLEYYVMVLRVNAWIRSKPGCGKTSMVYQMGSKHSCQMILPPPAVATEGVDWHGAPTIVVLPASQTQVERAATVFNLPTFLPTNPDFDGIIFVDEADQGPEDVQAALMQLTGPPYAMGGVKMPPRLRWIFAGNRREDKAGVNRIITPLLNRFNHIEFEPDADVTAKWALDNNWPGAEFLSSLLRYRPDLVCTFDASKDQRSFLSPRTLETVGKIIANPPPEHLMYAALEGTAGEAAAEIKAFYDLSTRLPSPEEIKVKPAELGLPSVGEPGLLHACVGMLTAQLRREPVFANAWMTYGLRMPTEFATTLLEQSLPINPEIRKLEVVKAFLKKYNKYFIQ